MLRRFFFTITFLFFVLLLFSQRRDVHDFSYAKELYSTKQYSLVHQICLKVYENEAINDRQKEDALYFIALSSKEMFNDDAKYWLEQFLIEYPYSLRVNSINYELALYYFRNANYQKAISYFLTCRSELDE